MTQIESRFLFETVLSRHKALTFRLIEVKTFRQKQSDRQRQRQRDRLTDRDRDRETD